MRRRRRRKSNRKLKSEPKTTNRQLHATSLQESLNSSRGGIHQGTCRQPLTSPEIKPRTSSNTRVKKHKQQLNYLPGSFCSQSAEMDNRHFTCPASSEEHLVIHHRASQEDRHRCFIYSPHLFFPLRPPVGWDHHNVKICMAQGPRVTTNSVRANYTNQYCIQCHLITVWSYTMLHLCYNYFTEWRCYCSLTSTQTNLTWVGKRGDIPVSKYSIV